MAKLEVNRFGEMQVFTRAVELGGFSAAARAFHMTPSAVSKLVSRLEARLGARLLNRSTRKLQLSAEGCAFYERSVQLLADLDDAERLASAGEKPAGRVRINTSASFAAHILGPLLPAFMDRFPDVTLDIVQTDAVIDLLEARTDVAIRAGPLKSSSLRARKLGATRMMIVGAPSYLERCGEPRSLADLQAHSRLGFSYARAVQGWPMLEEGTSVVLPTLGRVQGNDGELLRHLAIAGVGLARLAGFTIREDIRHGRLTPVLEHFNPGDLEEFHAVFLGQTGPLPARVRVLLDFLAERARVE